MRTRRKPDLKTKGDVHEASSDLLVQAATMLLNLESYDEIDVVKDKLDRVLRRHREGENIIPFTRHL